MTETHNYRKSCARQTLRQFVYSMNVLQKIFVKKFSTNIKMLVSFVMIIFKRNEIMMNIKTKRRIIEYHPPKLRLIFYGLSTLCWLFKVRIYFSCWRGYFYSCPGCRRTDTHIKLSVSHPANVERQVNKIYLWATPPVVGNEQFLVLTQGHPWLVEQICLATYHSLLVI